ncbi:tRNA preQ1(34) S-adenosylmethionine ribosyltransferase-isomerase QueA [Paenibacillus sp. J2TS4]|uniref:tRNA preQ1(34) S-adenosylmethionine ribosyltransferase-isomerase QueA n=1 Tax=Paenibacillus sp. J2TS4 TaxID=2807194 RepID=UPI001B2E20C6|nr:tRNA preQ1(34) S-adenosylmethionine ribosyltransferase-isomerase QueA [Paenibacillus sp. J2TS4]GIP31392.1 S-adenosylmethionine:tRNA ribosyltransferase-isomerase [Paenibacillus sp. J2TS4]
MDVELFNYELPEELIAQTPLSNRTHSRLMTLNKHTGEVEHHYFEQLERYLKAGDLLVLNDTRVIPARLFGCKADTGAKAEVLLLKSLGEDRWEALIRPGKRFREGSRIMFGSEEASEEEDTSSGSKPLLSAVVEQSGDMGSRILKFEYDGIFNEVLDKLGQMPLPPYIKERLDDRERYQTVYAKHEGSAAAPTAGLHFTSAYLERLQKQGIRLAYVTLHVGLGTFRPVAAERIEEHEMHSEFYSLPQETADAINETRLAGGRIIAVGTTSARTLETAARQCQQNETGEPTIGACSGWTDIFLYPGVPFLLVDALLTNFHLPKSTLLMLISAMAGRERILKAYEEAVQNRYRFFSFGDAMFIY